MTNSEVTFTEVVQKSHVEGGWHYLPLSKELLLKLRKLAGKNGNVPVIAKVGKTSWTTTIMSRGNQQWYLAIKAEVRATESINEGDKVVISTKPNKAKLLKR